MATMPTINATPDATFMDRNELALEVLRRILPERMGPHGMDPTAQEYAAFAFGVADAFVAEREKRTSSQSSLAAQPTTENA
jgi:hypothetical protein